MSILDRFTAKIRDANDALSTAHKSWRDEKLSIREEGLRQRDIDIKRRENEFAVRDAQIRAYQRERAFRKWKYLAVGLMAAVPAFYLGAILSSRSSPSGEISAPPSKARVAPLLPKVEVTPQDTRIAVPDNLDLDLLEVVPVWSDPQAVYKLVAWRTLPNGNREEINYRGGPSGETFARREIDCATRRFRYLGEGASISEVILDRPSPTMEEMTDGSISTVIADHVCAK